MTTQNHYGGDELIERDGPFLTKKDLKLMLQDGINTGKILTFMIEFAGIALIAAVN